MKKETIEKNIKSWFNETYKDYEFTFKYFDKRTWIGVIHDLAVIQFRIKNKNLDKGGHFDITELNNEVEETKRIIRGCMIEIEKENKMFEICKIVCGIKDEV